MKTTYICFSLAFLAAVGTGCSVINDVDSYSVGGVKSDAGKDASTDSDAGCVCPDDGNKCTKEVCVSGACTHPAATDKTDCNGGACYKGECCVGCWDGTTCHAGDEGSLCGGGGVACADCNDNNECTTDACTEKACENAKLGNGEACSGGICVAGTCECGTEGEPCCSSPKAQCEGTLVCKNGLCGTCGADTQPCCAGSVCAAGNRCNVISAICEACGSPGQPCCSGESCLPGGMCTAASKCEACGGVDQSCCKDGKPCASDSSVCDGQNICKPCGAAQQSCCTGSTCDTSNYCSSAKCLPCGVAGQTCCPSPAASCDAKSVCQSNSCVGCGDLNQPCCTSSTCNSATLICSGASCKTCGVKGSPCCAGDLCSGGSVVCDAAKNCVGCGNDGEACCPTGTACAAGATCNAGKCASCVQQIEAGDNHVCARKADGSVVCWGSDDRGQLGYTIGTAPLASSIPKAVPGLPLAAIDISAGGYHSCAILKDDSLWCWGRNDFGQLGTGTTSATNTVATKVTVLDAVSSVSVGWYHTCAIRKSDKQAYCWGQNVGTGADQYWQLGMGTDTANYISPTIVPGMTDIVSISAGSRNTCFVKSTGETYCVGYNADGEMGNNTTALVKSPALVPGISLSTISVGGKHVCGISKDLATSYCWGNSVYGQVGNNSLTNVLSPAAVQIGGGNARLTQIVTGVNHTCAKTDANALYCWGASNYGQSGNGVVSANLVIPTLVTILGSAIPSAISTGQNHTCVYRVDRSVACFGQNKYGQLGDGGPIVTGATAVSSPINPFAACN